MNDLRQRIIDMCEAWSDRGQREHAVELYRRLKGEMPWLGL